MLQVERLEKIRDYLLTNKYASITELAKSLDTSPSTIRRGLKELEQKNVVELTRGGAVLLGSGNTYEQPYSIKRRKNEDEKKRIAAYAATFITENNSIYLDASSTVREICPHLRAMRNITVCTNDILIAGDLSAAQELIVIVTGGILRQGFYALTGLFSEHVVDNIQVDYAFMGIDAIDSQYGFMLTDAEEVRNKQAIVKKASKRIILCDHEKFERSAFVNVWKFPDVSMVITGQELSDEIYEKYAELGLVIHRV